MLQKGNFLSDLGKNEGLQTAKTTDGLNFHEKNRRHTYFINAPQNYLRGGTTHPK